MPEISKIPHEIHHSDSIPMIVGESIEIQKIIETIGRVAKSDVNVLICGESGTGKEVVARNIHGYSHRSQGAFIPIDCVSLPDALLESELFGFEKGAFTGAVRTKMGLFELAEGGTLFLDEITELAPHLQAKLLRVLQERQFRRIGGKTLIDVNVRLISATSRNPETAVEEGRLRTDLYYRLNVVPIQVPPLRERKSDIKILIDHFIHKYAESCPYGIEGITPEAVSSLSDCRWEGNVRELENVIQRILSMIDHEEIRVTDIPEKYRKIDSAMPMDGLWTLDYKEAKKIYLDQFTQKYFKRLSDQHQGNMTRIAAASGLSRAMVYRIIHQLNISL